MADSGQKSALDKRIKKHVIGKPHRFLTIAPLGFESTLAEELKTIGIQVVDEGGESKGKSMDNASFNVVGDGKVEFTAKLTEAWKAIAYSRIANRILMEIANFKAENFGQLEKHATEVPWELFLEDCQASCISIHVTCKHSRLYHSDAVKERIQNVIGKRREKDDQNITQERSDRNPGKQHLYVNLIDDRCTLWLDLAGEELYKRGHDRYVAEAPLKETIAAAMIFEAFRLQNKETGLVTVVDPMAGSGTFSLEAAYIANGLIPGKCRDFALKHQPAFKEATWKFLLDEGRENENRNVILERSDRGHNGVRILTSDIDKRPIDIIKHNIECRALPTGMIDPKQKDFFSYTPQDIPETAFIFLNPPYGKRLDCDAPKLFARIGKKLNEFKGRIVAILVPKDCMDSLTRNCPALDSKTNKAAKLVETSHGGISLNAIFAKI